jgi:hypothetical protein
VNQFGWIRNNDAYCRSGRYCQKHPKLVINLLYVGVSENAKADANASNTIFNAQTFANVEASVGKQTEN